MCGVVPSGVLIICHDLWWRTHLRRLLFHRVCGTRSWQVVRGVTDLVSERPSLLCLLQHLYTVCFDLGTKSVEIRLDCASKTWIVTELPYLYSGWLPPNPHTTSGCHLRPVCTPHGNTNFRFHEASLLFDNRKVFNSDGTDFTEPFTANQSEDRFRDDHSLSLPTNT